MKTSYSVKAVIRKDKARADGTCPLYLQVIVNSKSLKLSLSEYVKPDDWDAKLNRVKRAKGLGNLDKRLNRAILEMEDFIDEEKSKGKPITIDLIKGFNKKEDKLDFYKYYDTFCERKFPNLSDKTRYAYSLLRKRLMEFRPSLRLNEIDLALIQDFDVYLKTVKNTGKGGIWNRHKNFTAALLNAKKMGLIEKTPYDEFKNTQPSHKTAFLSIRDVEKISKLDLSGRKDLELTRDKFLFSCYTGLRFSDVTNLKKDRIKEGLIEIEMIKTKRIVKVPLIAKAKIIICKYIKKEGELLFHKVSNQKVNYGLKAIASLAGVEARVTFHLARHTFGSNLGMHNVNAFNIMALMGHKSISQSAIYVNSNPHMLKEVMNKVSFGSK